MCVSQLLVSCLLSLFIVLQSPEHSVLSVAIHSLLEQEELWQSYLEDFTRQKLHLEFGSTGICNKILHTAFGTLVQRGALERLSILHVYVHTHKLSLARVVSVLRPLDRIEVAASRLPTLSQRIHSPHQSLFQDVGHGDDFFGKPEVLSTFIIDILFNAIAGINANWGRDMSETVLEDLRVWYNVYRDMVRVVCIYDRCVRIGAFLVPVGISVSALHMEFLYPDRSTAHYIPICYKCSILS